MLRKFGSIQWWKRRVLGAGLAGLVLAVSLAAATPASAAHVHRYWYHGGWHVYVAPAYPYYAYGYAYPYAYPYPYGYPYYYGPPAYYAPPAVGFGFRVR